MLNEKKKKNKKTRWIFIHAPKHTTKCNVFVSKHVSNQLCSYKFEFWLNILEYSRRHTATRHRAGWGTTVICSVVRSTPSDIVRLNNCYCNRRIVAKLKINTFSSLSRRTSTACRSDKSVITTWRVIRSYINYRSFVNHVSGGVSVLGTVAIGTIRNAPRIKTYYPYTDTRHVITHNECVGSRGARLAR